MEKATPNDDSSKSKPTDKPGVKANGSRAGTKSRLGDSFFSRMSKNDTFATRDAKAKSKARREAATASTRTKPKNHKNTVTRTPPSTISSVHNAPKSSIDRARVRTAGSSKKSTSNNSRKMASGSSKKSTPSNKQGKVKNLSRGKSYGTISTKSDHGTMPVEKTVDPIEASGRVVKRLSAQESIEVKLKQGRRQSTILQSSLLGLTSPDLNALFDLDDDDLSLNSNGIDKEDDLDPDFKSRYAPEEMRCMALVAHNLMKPPMKNFVLANKNLLKKFKLTGTNTTMTMLKEVFVDDPDVVYGPTCQSGPLGGDAELVAVMCTENLGACVFFQDPMTSHPHISDIACLSRQANVHNIIMMPNPASAYACMTTLRVALEKGKAELIPSFFETLQSPSVEEYKKEQARVLASNVKGEEDEDDNDFS